MAKRPRSHQLETLSVNEFVRRLPATWVYRTEAPDYGIDGSVEIFGEREKATGLRFYVQIKASDKRGPKSIRLSRSTAEYYEKLELPVLLAFYSAADGNIWSRWYHEFDPYYGGLAQKSVTIRLDDGDSWTSETPSKIRRDLEVFTTVLRSRPLPLPIPYTVNADSQSIPNLTGIRIETAVRRHLAKFPKFFEYSENPALIIGVERGELSTSFRGRYRATMHINEAPLEVTDLCKNTLLLFSFSCGKSGHHELAATVAEYGIDGSLASTSAGYALLAENYAHSGRIARALELGKSLLGDDEMRPILDIVLTGAVLGKQKDHIDAAHLESHLIERVNFFSDNGDAHSLATSRYNLGNFFRGQSRFREAVREYRAAVVAHGGYGQRNYLCREIASCLFLAGRFSASAMLYRRAVEQQAPPFWRGLLADALMYSGDFEAAATEFANAIDEMEQPVPEWLLKLSLLRVIGPLRPAGGRETAAAKAALANPELPASGEQASAALKHDPLLIPAWLVLANAPLAEGDDDTRLTALLIAAVLAQNDPHLWAAAFVGIAGQPAGENGLAMTVAFAAIQAVNDAFIEEIHVLLEAAEVPAETHDLVTAELSQLEREFDKIRIDQTVELRMSGEGSDFTTFDLGSGAVEYFGSQDVGDAPAKRDG